MRYDAVLFDLDGTLADSAQGVMDSVRYAAAQMGWDALEDEILRTFVGPSMFDSMRRYYGRDEAETAEGERIYREYHDANHLLRATVFEGVPNLLRGLKATGMYVAVATNKPQPLARQVLEHLGLLRFFDQVIGPEMGSRQTDKDPLLRAALPARYGRAVMIGDRGIDMEAAVRVGIDCIGAGWGYGTDEELRGAGAELICPTVADCARVLLGKDAKPPQGFFISIEGLDGSGKTTQMNAIAEHMRDLGYEVVTTREPGGTPIGEEIRPLVLSPDRVVCPETEALLYAAARAQHVCDVIRPALAAGKAVLCDRFVDSSIVYQGAGRELGIPQVQAINAFAIQGTMPDLTILLVVDAQTGFLRRNSATTLDRIERSGEAFFRRVYDAFARLQRENPERIRCVDGQRDKEAVAADACALVDRLLMAR